MSRAPRPRGVRRWCAWAALPLVAACADGPTGPEPTSLRLGVTRLSFDAPGQAASLQVSVGAAGAPLPVSAVRFTSLDTAVARVDADGVVRAFGAGRTRVVAAAGALADTAELDVTFDRPVWRFTLTAALSEASRAGRGLAEVRRELARHVDTLNARFNDPRAFDGFLHFELVESYVFTRAVPAELAAPAERSDFKAVYHSDPSYHAAWYDPGVRVVQIGGRPDSILTTAKARVLVHEMGHARGAPDLYPAHVQLPRDNPVTGETFAFPPSIMQATLDSPVWDELSRYMVDRAGARRDPEPGRYLHELVPELRVRVVDAAAAVPGATVDVHLVQPGVLFESSSRVIARAAYTTTTGGDGIAPLDFRHTDLLLLVTARHGERRGSAWLTMVDIARHVRTGSTEPYELVVTLP